MYGTTSQPNDEKAALNEKKVREERGEGGRRR
jgi:hypothetical protein